MRQKGNSIALLMILISFAFIYSCTQKTKENKVDSDQQLSLNKNIFNLLNDTSKVNPLVDSLRKSILSSETEKQMELISELAETWRPHTYSLATELLYQAKALNKLHHQASANAKFGIYYARKYNFDSAHYFLNETEKIAKEINSDALSAEAQSWRAEILRMNGLNDSVINSQDVAIALAKKANDKKRLAFCNISKGEAYRFIGQSDKAIECYENAIAFAQEINDITKITICYNSLGEVYRIQSNFPEALNYYNKALSLAKQMGNKNQIAFCLSCMGDIYTAQKEVPKALKFYNESYEIAVELGAQVQQCNILSSMSLAYDQEKNYTKALEYIEKSNKLAEEIGYVDKLAFGYVAKGQIIFNQGKYNEAIEAVNKAVPIAIETGNTSLLANCYNQLSEVYIRLKKYNEAKIVTEKSLKLSYENGVVNNIRDAARLLAEIYKVQNQYKASLDMLYTFIRMRDSVNNEENVKRMAAIEYQAKEEGLKAEQRAKEIEFKAEQEKKETELKRQKTIRYAFTIGFILVLLLVGVVYRSLQQNKKQNKIIVAQKKEVEHQKELVEEKNKEITDSITYAKRLQDAIMPPLKMVKQHFPESFILYKPKDIIAGDFYWMEAIDNNVFFAAADSTGHGVPGALVSVVCSNALNRALKEFKLNETGKILDKTRELVLETFEKSEGQVKDGMDISLICVNHKLKTISWSGANNPLWYINKNGLQEIKANKQSIGKTENPMPFTTHHLNYEEGTIFYLITDGFADQFGGPKGKKFKYKQLQEHFLSNKDKNLSEQQTILDTSFESWRGELEQVDDVTLIGFKI